MRYLLILFLFACSSLGVPSSNTLAPNPEIRLNQVGFLPNGPKMAVIVNAPDGPFFIKKVADGRQAYRSILGEEMLWDYSQEKVRIADFTELTENGKYYVEVPGKGTSAPFSIGEDVFRPAHRAVLRSFYLMRNSAEIPPKYGETWPRALGHPDTEVYVHESAASPSRPEGSVISSSKGWYDAGDYGKYTPTATFATWVFLSLYEQFPEMYEEFDFNIPESGDALPDILDEAKWSLDWLLTMQEPEEGFVYHKLTTEKHARKVMPDEDLGKRYVIGKNTAASLSFAAVMAQAARVYKKSHPDFADSCLQAAQKAWKWSRDNANVAFMDNPPGIHTGVCKDNVFEDDFSWAATELFISTGRDSFLQAANLDNVRIKRGPNRRNVTALPFISLAANPGVLSKQKMDLLNKKVLRTADRFKNYTLTQSAYRVSIGEKGNHFNWGSNGLLSGIGMLMIHAWKISGDESYLDVAIHNLDYIMGRNATTYCMLTGFGYKSPQNIHHRPSEADGIPTPVEGFIVGGPQNKSKVDGVQYPQRLPATQYLDIWKSYTTNEVAINWNAPFLYLLAGVEYSMMNGYSNR